MTVFSEAMKETNGVFLFPNRNGTGPLLHRAIDHTLSRAMAPTDVHPLGRLGAAKFTPHDLRKTFATQMSRAPNGIAVPQQVIAHLLNHRSSTKSSVTQIVYDQNDFFDEKREAMLKWDTWLSSLTSAAGENAENSSTEW